MEQSTESLRDGFETTRKLFYAPTDTSHLDAVTKRNVTICNLFFNHSLAIKDIGRILDEPIGKVVRTLIEEGLIVERRKVRERPPQGERRRNFFSNL